jgi:hypothetical protein
MGEECQGLPSQEAHAAGQEGRPSHPIDIIVTVHEDGLFPVDGSENAFYGKGEVLEGLGGVEPVCTGAKMAFCVLRILEAPSHQESTKRPRELQALLQDLHITIPWRWGNPPPG